MKRSISEKITGTINSIFLILIGLITFYPFYYIFIYSISDPSLAAGGVYFIPKGITLVNYEQLFQDNMIFNALFISFLRTALGTLLTVFCCTMLAFGLSKKNLPHRKLFVRLIVFTMYIDAGIIPVYMTIKMFGLKDNFLVYVLPLMINAFYVILIKAFMEQLPEALEEAARIDGANYFKLFFKIIIPVSLPIIATVTIFNSVDQWNSWYDNLLYCPNPKLRTLQMLLMNYLNQASIAASSANEELMREKASMVSPFSLRMAITFIVVLPIYLVYPFMQKYFVKGIMIGAIKG